MAPLQRKFSRDHDGEYLEQLKQKGMAVNDVDKQAFVTLAKEKIWPQFEPQYGKDMQAILSIAG